VRGRRTKIVATLGPATDAPEVLDRVIAAGMDCARLNCSHGTHDDLRKRAAAVRAAAQRAGRPIGLLFDLQGPKLRLSAETEARILEVDDTVVFCGSEGDDGPGRERVDLDHFHELITERSQIVVGDGVPRLAVESVAAGDVVTRVVSPGPLGPRKGINVTYARPELPAITDKDIADLALAAELDADFVALSFVRSAADMEELRERLRALPCPARIIAKIEKIEAYEHLDEIIDVTDGIMVARGDYGVEAGVARVPLMQKDTIARATQAGKLVITATQMLESMIHAPEPTRGRDAVGRDRRRQLSGRGRARDGRDRHRGRARAGDPRPRAQRQAGHGGRRGHARGDRARPRARGRGARGPDRDRRRPAGVRQVPRPAPDRRRRARPPRRRPAHARVGRPPGARGGRQGRGRDDRRRAVGRPRCRRRADRRHRRDHGGPPYRHPRRDEPHHGARDPMSVPPICPSCDQPASEALGGPEHDWECRNEACPEFGQPIAADEPDPPDDSN
jgi:pyruvate kinase-like protein